MVSDRFRESAKPHITETIGIDERKMGLADSRSPYGSLS